MSSGAKNPGLHGRGASASPPNRFFKLSYTRDPDLSDDDQPSPKTEFLRDASRSIITRNQSPDVGFEASVNPYRGCEHGCIYCYARPTHEYLGFSAGLDFETKILVKEDAPQLLRQELMARKWQPQVLGISGVTDPYQPVERRMELTRRCLEVLVEFRNPAAIITKNHLVTRDIDLLSQLAAHNCVAVFVSVTTLDEKLANKMEPRTSTPARRLAAIQALASAGIPTGVMTAPIVPGLTDHETPNILAAAAQAGATSAGYTIVRLPLGVADLFEQWLTENYPDRKEKVLNHIRDIRNGRLNDPNFKSRMSGEGVYAEQIKSLFRLCCRKNHLNERRLNLSTDAFRRPSGPQPGLFDEIGL